MKGRQLFLFVSLLLLISNILIAQSEIATLNVQGILRDNSGKALEDKAYSITFRIYDQETGGNYLWSENQSVQLSNGVFNAVLGTSTSFASANLGFDKAYWVGVSVDGANEYSPRIRLTSSPYALSLIGSSNKFPSSGTVQVGTESSHSDLSVKGNVTISGLTEIGGSLEVDQNLNVINIDCSELTADLVKVGNIRDKNNAPLMRIKRITHGQKMRNVAGDGFTGRTYLRFHLGVYDTDFSATVAGYDVRKQNTWTNVDFQEFAAYCGTLNGEWVVDVYWGEYWDREWHVWSENHLIVLVDVLLISKKIVSDER